MHHHLWSETRQTGYSVGVTVRLESALSALDLVKKMERVKERRSSNHATKDHPEEITKNLHAKLVDSLWLQLQVQRLPLLWYPLVISCHLWLGLTIVEHSCLALANQLVSCKLWKL